MQNNNSISEKFQEAIPAALPVGQGDLMDRESKSTADPSTARRGPSRGRPSTPIFVFDLDETENRFWTHRRKSNGFAPPELLSVGQVFRSISALAEYLGMPHSGNLHTRLGLSLKDPDRISRPVAGAVFKFKLSE